MSCVARILLMIAGFAALAISAGFLFDQAWATGLWPWPGYRSSEIFVASMLAAVGAPIVWIAASREYAAIAGGAFNLFVAGAGMASFAFAQVGVDLLPPRLAAFAVVSALIMLMLVPVFFWSRGHAFADDRPTPALVKFSFWIFAAILTLVGIALVLGRPNTFPWSAGSSNETLYGWFFLGAAFYFIYGSIHPVWANAKGQLIGFLAYDLVLIVPIFRSFQTVPDARFLSLAIYGAVVVYSCVLSVFYLFIHPQTRLFSGSASGAAAIRLSA